WTAERSRPLIVVDEPTLRYRIVLLVEEVVAVHADAVPTPDRIAVICVRSSFADVVDVRAGHGILTGITVAHYRSFAHVILTEQNVSGSGVIQIQERIVFRHAVNSEVIRIGGQSIAGKVAESRLRIHHGSRRCLSDVA